MRFSLFAFDLDDTLIDTFAVSVPNCVEMVNAEYGVPIRVDDWTKENGYRGKAGQGLLDAIAADYGAKLDLQHFLALRKEWLYKQLLKGMPVAPGITGVLNHLHASNRPMCVCTNSMADRAALTLAHAVTGDATHLPTLFGPHVYSAVPNMQAKPAPDVYLHAARRFGIAPASALAMEDTPTGVQAACAAGFATVGYVGLHSDPAAAAHKLAAAGACHVIHHWDEFVPLLHRLEA